MKKIVFFSEGVSTIILFAINKQFFMEGTVSHSEIVCIEISIMSMISIFIVFFPNDNQESHWPRKVLIRALAHNIPLKYYKSRDQIPGNQGGTDLGHTGADILQVSVWISPLTGLGVVTPVVVVVITSYQSPAGHHITAQTFTMCSQ